MSLNIILMHKSVYIIFPLCLSTATLVCFSCSYSLSRKERDGLSLRFVISQSTKATSVFDLHVFFNTNLICRDDFQELLYRHICMLFKRFIHQS